MDEEANDQLEAAKNDVNVSSSGRGTATILEVTLPVLIIGPCVAKMSKIKQLESMGSIATYRRFGWGAIGVGGRSVEWRFGIIGGRCSR